MNHFVIFRTALCPHCRLEGYGVIYGYVPRDFQPCPACELVIQRILAMEVVEESVL
jgi:hypothetical protein